MAKVAARRRTWEMSLYSETKMLKDNAPSITEPIKQAKIMPRGSEGERTSSCAAFNAGVQKNTKRNMLPSKTQEASPSVRMRLSVKNILIAFLAGAEGVESEDWWVSP